MPSEVSEPRGQPSRINRATRQRHTMGTGKNDNPTGLSVLLEEPRDEESKAGREPSNGVRRSESNDENMGARETLEKSRPREGEKVGHDFLSVRV